MTERRTTAATTAWVLHDLGLAAGFGGSLFGKVGLNPAVRAIPDERERGMVVHDAWEKYRYVHAVALAAMAGTWLIGRTLTRRRGFGGDMRALTLVKDALVAGAFGTGMASWVVGNMLAKECKAREADVPIISGGKPPRDSLERARKLHRAVNMLGTVNVALDAAAIGVTAVLAARSTDA